MGKNLVQVTKLYSEPETVKERKEISAGENSMGKSDAANFAITPPPTAGIRPVYVVRVKFQGDPTPSQAEAELQPPKM